MRVLQLISSAGRYGAEGVLLNLAQHLAALDCETVIGIFDNAHRPSNGFQEFARSRHLTVESIPCRGRLDWDCVRAIRGCIQARDIEIVHTHGYKADVYGFLAARKLNRPVMATAHNWTRSNLALRAFAAVDRGVLRRFDKIAAVSDYVAASLVRGGCKRDRVEVIPNGVDCSVFGKAQPVLASQIGIPGQAIVGVVGRMAPGKGLEYFLDAACGVLAEARDAVFVMVGDGPERPRLEALCTRLGIRDKVAFVGQRDDMPEVYASLALLVLPSLNEGMPLVVLEALASGCAVVATRVGAVPKVVIHEQTGLLVSPGSTHELRQAMVRLLRERDLAKKLAQNGCRLVRQHYSSERMADKYFALYEELSKSRVTVGSR